VEDCEEGFGEADGGAGAGKGGEGWGRGAEADGPGFDARPLGEFKGRGAGGVEDGFANLLELRH